MRDSILIFSIFGILTAGFFGLLSSSKTVSKTKLKSPGDIKHESTNHRSREQKRLVKSRTRITGETSESDQLPDLYEREEPAEGLSLNEGTELMSSSEQPTGETVIAGVPVAAWVRSNKNRLKDYQISSPSEQNLRVFIGCFELKKESRPTDKATCEKLLLSKEEKLHNERNRY